MPTPTKGPRLGGSPSHERIIMANLATQLFEHGKITTTEAKAKRLRPVAEKLITKAKRGDLHARRTVMATIRDKSIVHVLFTEIAPTFNERDGGYLRITKVGPRKGDNAPMAQIELVTESVSDSKKANDRSAPVKKSAPAKKAAAAPEPAAAEPEVPVEEISASAGSTDASTEAPAPDQAEAGESTESVESTDEDAAKKA